MGVSTGQGPGKNVVLESHNTTQESPLKQRPQRWHTDCVPAAVFGVSTIEQGAPNTCQQDGAPDD